MGQFLECTQNLGLLGRGARSWVHVVDMETPFFGVLTAVWTPLVKAEGSPNPRWLQRHSLKCWHIAALP